MIKFTTESGSQYELDEARLQIRRLSGSMSPTERQGSDGEWKSYALIYESPEIGKHVLIVWRVTEEGIWQSTRTSPIVALEVT